ncbi:hypothetical protein CMK11_00480 [Candidatus Poribacteria bacterium]|nr:hypothetical protein [Candidatus Poribacteria bacterium]
MPTHRRYGFAVVVVVLSCMATLLPAQSDDAWDDVARVGDGAVVWESNRTGRWRIWGRDLDGSDLRQITPDEPGRDHYCPHISPDGARLLYLSYPRNRNGYQDHRGSHKAPLHLLDLRTGADTVLAQDARAYFEDRAAVWVDAGRFIFIGGDGKTYEHDLATGARTPLTDARHDEYGWLMNATKTHATAGWPEFSPFDASSKTIAHRQRQGGCQPYFTHDGVWGYWMGGGGGPVQRINLETRETSTILRKNDQSLPNDRSYIYFPMSSYGGELFAFGASPNQHDHHTADYDIFVARTDPRTLEIIGKPARYSFDGGTDRFPDVFVRQLELGRSEGEAPYTVRFDPGDDERREWTSGDGRTRDGETFEHTYDDAGVYRVEARNGDQSLRGEVAVTPRRRPTPTSVYVRGDNEIVVTFDEPVQEREGKARLDSGLKIRQWRWEEDGRRVVLAAERAIEGEDRLKLEDVRDRAQKPNKMEKTYLRIHPPTWPSDRTSLVVGWRAGEASAAGAGAGGDGWQSYGMDARGAARKNWEGVLRLAGGSYAIDGADDALLAACRDSGALTVEAVLRADTLTQGGPARIVSFSSSAYSRNFTLGQERNALVLRLRTPNTGENGTPPETRLCGVDGGSTMHVVASYAAGRLVCYLNGEKVSETDAVRGDLSNWAPHRLVLGDEWDGGRDWAGELEGVAIYSRAMDATEAMRNYHDFRQLRDKRRAELPVVWPSDRSGAVFVRGTSRSDNLVSAGGVERAYDAHPRGMARLDRNFAMSVASGAFVAPDVDDALLRDLRAANRLTVEAVVRPDSLDQTGPARIVSFSTDSGSRNFTLGQDGDTLVFRLRTPATGANGANPETALCKIAAGRYTHVVVTYSPGRLVCYRDGVKALDTDRIKGDLANWERHHLIFGDEWRDSRDWRGAIEGVAIYRRVLDAAEARANYEAYRRVLESRDAVPELDARAKLLTRSDVPSLSEIQPYREALVVYEYDVENVMSGQDVAGRIRVAHWAILDGETLAVARWDEGQSLRLHLEPFANNPQLETFYMSDTLEPDFDVPLYYAVTP